MKKHLFGTDLQWAISMDDHCLLFHPQHNIDPSKTTEHVWREAYLEVEKLGGFDATINFLRLK